MHGSVLSKKQSIGQFLPWNTIYFPSVLQSAIVPVVNLRLSLPCKQLFLYNKKQSESNTDKPHFDWLPSSHIFRLEDMSWCPHFGNCYIAWKFDKSKRFKKHIMLLHKSEKSQFGSDILWYSKPKVHFCVKVIQQRLSRIFKRFLPKTDADRWWSTSVLFTFYVYGFYSNCVCLLSLIYSLNVSHLII